MRSATTTCGLLLLFLLSYSRSACVSDLVITNCSSGIFPSFMFSASCVKYSPILIRKSSREMSLNSRFSSWFPAVLVITDQSRRTRSMPFTSRCAFTAPLTTDTTFSAAYFFFFSSSMRLNT